MADPIAFPSTTTNFSIPLLFAGQAQKEPFINHAFSMIDGLLTGVVIDSLATPPTQPAEGSTFRILTGATGDWAGHEDKIATYIGGGWDLVSPRQGMVIFDQEAGIQLRYAGSWQIAVEPPVPSGGGTIDSEARTAISELISALRAAGIFASQP